jgi:hypothetical protein
MVRDILVEEFKQKMKSANEIFEGLKKQAGSALRSQIGIEVAMILQDSKKIKSIGWKQYTPYFNDGEECEFGTTIRDLDINGEWYQSFLKPNKEEYDAHEAGLVKKIKTYLSPIEDEVLIDLFGDHVEIVIHNDSRIEVLAYDHE